jgi:hypothetical protein
LTPSEGFDDKVGWVVELAKVETFHLLDIEIIIIANNKG